MRLNMPVFCCTDETGELDSDSSIQPLELAAKFNDLQCDRTATPSRCKMRLRSHAHTLTDVCQHGSPNHDP